MKRMYLMLAVIAGLLANSAYAVEQTKGQRFEPAKTRQEAIARVEKRLAELKAMSDKDWEAKRAEQQKRFAERRARFQERKAAREATPAAGTATTKPAAPIAPATKPAQ